MESERYVGTDSIFAGVNSRIWEEAFHRIGVVFEGLERLCSKLLMRRDNEKMAGIHMDETSTNNAAVVDATWVDLNPLSLRSLDDDTHVDREVHDIEKMRTAMMHTRDDFVYSVDMPLAANVP